MKRATLLAMTTVFCLGLTASASAQCVFHVDNVNNDVNNGRRIPMSGTASGNAAQNREVNTPSDHPDRWSRFTFTVQGFQPGERVLDVNLNLDIVHSWVEDLNIWLRSPSGTWVQLFNRLPGGPPRFDNFDNTYFTDEASIHIEQGSAPYSGNYKPYWGEMREFRGETPNGTWELWIYDHYFGDYGKLYRRGDGRFEENEPGAPRWRSPRNEPGRRSEGGNPFEGGTWLEIKVNRVRFTHIKSVDLSAYFPMGGSHGNLASDVAFDGSNLYIAGMSTANTTAESVGVLKISNVLSLDMNSWTYTPLITLTQAGQSRSSYIVYRNGFLYLGTGLGDGGNTADRTGVRKFDASTGTQISGWNSTGVVLPSDLSGSGRAECIEIDPGHQGNDPSLAVLARGRGIIFRRDFASGVALPNILSMPSHDCQGGQTTTGMRDITFSPEGDAYLRVDNSIFYAQRTADNTVDQNRACRIFNFDTDNVFQVLINIHYLRTASGDYLIYNRRTGSAANRVNTIFVASGSEANWTLYAEITGDEPLPNGSTPDAYTYDIFNFTSGFGPDPSRGDVNLDGVIDDADFLEILFAFGTNNTAVDTNSDGVVDDYDILVALFNFGSVSLTQHLFVVHSTIETNRLDIYRIDAGGCEPY